MDTGLRQEVLKKEEAYWDRKTAGPVTPASPATGSEVAASASTDTAADAAAGEATTLHPAVEGVMSEGTEGFTDTQLQQLREILGRELDKAENKFANPDAPTESELENVRTIKNNAISSLRTTRIEGGPVADAPSEDTEPS